MDGHVTEFLRDFFCTCEVPRRLETGPSRPKMSKQGTYCVLITVMIIRVSRSRVLSDCRMKMKLPDLHVFICKCNL